MAFGRQAGPPASHKQVQNLLQLLQNAGHTDFRDARGPMGFTQRQAGGKFTRDEIDAFIAQLEEAEDAETLRIETKPAQRASRYQKVLRDVPTEEITAELQRRGWSVTEP